MLVGNPRLVLHAVFVSLPNAETQEMLNAILVRIAAANDLYRNRLFKTKSKNKALFSVPFSVI